MATVEEALQSQLRNIETATGRPIPEWIGAIRASGHARHREIVKWLQSEHGLSYGNANRLALVALAGGSTSEAAGAPVTVPDSINPVDDLYSGAKAGLRPIHERVMAVLIGFGEPIEVAPKKGYVSLRRRTQLGMLKPGARNVDVGLILPGQPATPRLESAGTWNGMMTHRVRLASVGDVDAELVSWLRAAWERSG